ncbi:hypothetical protein [Dyadobacter luticola]|uniref:GNAT family N-acetyltransferase n=1 Tax=Dyadobacter luticola TaxID=1979387 RepID=A0A5R9L3F7_9BACT|nr:hypothetical protein [Dyadobacter luticola]TLV02917.1 hypothetical protein FEN17_04700 [Dyadobacter luticola]
MIQIFKTKPGETDFHLFEKLPESIYQESELALKKSEKIPVDFLEGCYYLTDREKVVARASLYFNPFLKYHDAPACTVGTYECAENATYAITLLDHLKEQAKTLDASYLIGPMNGSTWENYRFSTDRNNPPYFLEPFHHLYYNDQFQDAGFEVIARYYTNIDSNLELNEDAALTARQQELFDEGVVIRPIDLQHFEDEIGRIYAFNEIAFKTNFLYTPISQKAFLDKYLPTKNLINPALTLLAEDENGTLIGYYFCIQDFLNTTEKSLIVKTLARHPDPNWKGLGHVIGNIVYGEAMKLGFTSALHPFIYQQGTSMALSKNFSGVNYKNYALYGVKID